MKVVAFLSLTAMACFAAANSGIRGAENGSISESANSGPAEIALAESPSFSISANQDDNTWTSIPNANELKTDPRTSIDPTAGDIPMADDIPTADVTNSFRVATIPEPSTILLGAIMTGAALLMRRRKL